MENLKILSKMGLSFQKSEDFNKDMKEILEITGKFINLSRIHIFIKESEDIINNTFEWCNKDIPSEIQSLQNIKYGNIENFQDEIFKTVYLELSQVRDLSQEIINILKLEKVKSLLAYPIVRNKEPLGFISFEEDTCKRIWEDEELEILETLSSIISNAYDRKICEEERVIRETNLKNIFTTIDDMFFVSDINGNIITCNLSAIEKLGYSQSEYKKINLIELHPENARKRASVLLQEMLRKERKFCPIPFISKNGEIYPVESRVWIGKWNNEDCIYAISKDLSKENQEFQVFAKMFSNNPLPMSINDITNKSFIKVNPAFLEKTGYREEDIVGKKADEVGIFVHLSKIKAIREKKLKGYPIRDEEVYIRRRDGKQLKHLISIEDITIQGKESFLMVMVDITERDELAKSVEDKLQKLTNVIDGTSLGTWEWDIITGEIEINEHFAKMIGYTMEELNKHTVESVNNFIHPEDLSEAADLMKKHLNGETDYYDFDIRMKHKDGRWIWIQDIGKVTQRDENGTPIKMFGTYTDITLRKEADKVLKESEERFLHALDQTKAGLWDMDMESGSVFLSPMWKEILGYRDDEIENSFEILKGLSHKDDIGKLRKIREDHLKRRKDSFEIVHRLKHKDGKWRWILTRGGILRDKNGIAKRWIGTNIDITLEHEQSLETERFFSINLDLLCILDIEGIFIKTNKAWEEILGYPSNRLKGKSFKAFIHLDDIPKTVEAWKELIKEKRLNNFINRYLCEDGEYHYIEWKANLYEDVIYAAARDITDRIHYENKILEISNKDSLTNVYNRRYIYDKAEDLIEEYKNNENNFSICILDIDEFKVINDTYGHQIGDYILKEFVKVIEKNLRSCDMLGRYGGEEFIVILDKSSLEESAEIMERILTIIRNTTFSLNEIDINFTFSAGISNSKEIDKNSMGIDDLVKLADQRMYEAKNTNRNRVVSG